jgi:hypothetical protein
MKHTAKKMEKEQKIENISVTGVYKMVQKLYLSLPLSKNDIFPPLKPHNFSTPIVALLP